MERITLKYCAHNISKGMSDSASVCSVPEGSDSLLSVCSLPACVSVYYGGER